MQTQMIDLTSAKPRPVPVVETPQSLVLACTRAAYRTALADLLQQAGFSMGSGAAEPAAGQPALLTQEQVGPMGDWPDWLDEHPKAHVLLLVALPSVAVARRLQEGSVPKTALADWMASAQDVLDVIRSQRRRISLMFAEPALAEPQAFVELLSRRLQLTLQAVSPEQQVPDLPSALLRLMAENAIWQSADARNIAAELEANALPLADSELSQVPAIDQVFTEYRNSIDRKARAAQELREENELLLEQLQRVQQKMEAFSAEKRAIEQQLSAVEELKQENELLLSQLHQVQEELEGQLLKTKAAEEKLFQAEKVASTSTNDAQLKDLQEENDLLLQQLHHVQEELERYYLQSMQPKGLPSQYSAQLEAAHETIRAIYNSYSWRLTWPLRVFLRIFGAGPASSKKAPLPDNLEAAEATIQALYNSKSWKVTKPLRALAGGAGKK